MPVQLIGQLVSKLHTLPPHPLCFQHKKSEELHPIRVSFTSGMGSVQGEGNHDQCMFLGNCPPTPPQI